MKKTILILFAAFFSLQAIVGCGGGEDNAVKEAPAEAQTKSADEMGRGRMKSGEGSGEQPLGTERDSRAGG